MAKQILNHDLRCVDGVTLFLPPHPESAVVNMAQPDVHAESATQLYPIGTLAWYAGEGKKFRYCKAAADMGTNYRNFLAAFGNYVPDSSTYANVNGFYGTTGVIAKDVGDTDLTFTDTVDKAVDFFAGAYFMHFTSAGQCRETGYVISGPATASTDPWSTTVKIHKPLKYAIVADDPLEIWCSPYGNIKAGCVQGDAYDGYETYAGVPLIPITDTYYFWLQTAGPCFITPNGWSTLCPGYAANSRIVMVGGSAGHITTQAASGTGYQPIGELLCVTESQSASAFVNMDLDLGH